MTAVVEAPPVGRATGQSSAPRAGQGLLSSGWSRSGGLVVALVVLAIVTLLSIAFGSKPIPLGGVFEALFSYDAGINDHLVVRSLRVPRTALGLVVGAALGIAGAVMQGITRNPLADPGILGIEAGASLAVVLGISLLGMGSLGAYVWLAFLGAGAASVVVYALGSLGRGGATPVKLALAGAALTSLFGSLTQAVLLSDLATLDQFRFWVVGSLAGRDGDIASQCLPFMTVGLLLAVGSARQLNVLALGDDVARSLGQRVHLARGVAATGAIVLAATATAACGPIGFVGLTIPHVARGICGPDHRWLLPWSAVLGSILLLGADVVGRVVARPGELQVGIVTALVGAPFFIALVRRRKLAGL